MQITDFTHIKSAKAPAIMPAEYTIYAYNKYCENTIGHNQWQCLSSSDNATKAIEDARILFDSSKFQKIEIKKKFFDKKKDRYAVSTFKVFDNKPKTKMLIIATAILLTALALGLFFLEVL